MEDRTVFNCEEIKKRLQPFLEDLLAEDEYQAYVHHLNTCVKCKDYVGRFGSLSNQVRELGNIKVPSDFFSAVRFNISEPVEEPQTTKDNRKKNLITGIVVTALVLAGIWAGIIYSKKHGPSRKADGSPITTMQVIMDKNPSPGGETGALLNELKSIASSLGVPDKKEESKEISGPAPSASDRISAKESAAKTSDPNPLHWHFQYNEKSNDGGLKNDLQGTELKVQKELEARKKLLFEIELLKQKTQQAEFGKQYSEKDRDVKSNEALRAADELRKKQGELETLSSDIERLKKEGQGTEDTLRRGSEERQRKESERKEKLLDALTALNIKLDYQNYDILVFTATGEKNRSIIQKMLSISADSFGDFTARVPTFPDKEQKVSIYMSRDTESALHWHIKESGAGKKTDLFNSIRELGGTIDYESNGLAVFSLPSAELKDLRVRIQAMGMSLTEYGAEGSKGGILISGPIVVSVCFTN